MDISGISSGSIAATTSASSSSAKPTDTPVATASAPAATTPSATAPASDTVTLSPAAQQTVATAAAGTTPAKDAAASTDAAKAAVLDLSGKDLRTTDLKSLGLKGANLSGANLSGVDLSGLDLSGANLTNADLSNVTAKGTNFSGAHLENTKLDNGDFSNAKFDNAFIGKTEDVEDEWHQPTTLTVNNAKFDDASFAGTTTQRVIFEKISATNADFSGLNTITSTSFRDSNLQNANFDHAGGETIDFRHSDVSNATFSHVNFVGTLPMGNATWEFGACTMNGTKFAGSSLNFVEFVEDNLTTANFADVIRSGIGASFVDSNMSGMDFSGFDFTGAEINHQTRSDTDPNPVAGSGLSLAGTNFKNTNFSYGYIYDVDQSKLGQADFTDAVFSHTLVSNCSKATVKDATGEHDASEDDIVYYWYDAAITKMDKVGGDTSLAKQLKSAVQVMMSAVHAMQALDAAETKASQATGKTRTTAQQDTKAAQTDADKALAILKAYAAGQGDAVDRDKALDTLRGSITANSGNEAALIILSKAAETAQGNIVERYRADHPSKGNAATPAGAVESSAAATAPATSTTQPAPSSAAPTTSISAAQTVLASAAKGTAVSVTA